MRILAVDTATKSCSVAVTENETVLGEITKISEQTHSKHLLEMVHTVIREAGLILSDLDGFAVTRGPGSFTGLRIGISSIKGLALAVNKPVVGISSLLALAQQARAFEQQMPTPAQQEHTPAQPEHDLKQQISPTSHLVCPLIDARKGEVYVSLYRCDADALTSEHEERVLAPQEALQNIDSSCMFVGSGAVLYRDIITDQLGDVASFAPDDRHIIQASTVARLGLEQFKSGEDGEVADLVPYYIRKSDAELNFKKNQ